jgi:hypothetical protein
MRVRVLAFGIVASLLVGCSALPASSTSGLDNAKPASFERPAKNDLLYISEQQSAEVNVYAYSDGHIGQKVFGMNTFRSPNGMCTNKDGDVFITDSGYSKIFRYHHGGNVPYRTIHEPGMERASSCSVSPVTAELAVANHQNWHGNVRIFPADKHTGKAYKLSRVDTPFSLAYDNQGNLFVTSSQGHLYELPAHGSQFEQLSISGGQLEYPLGIVFTNPYLLVAAVGSNNEGVGYKMTVANGVAQVDSIIPFAGTEEALTLAFRAGNVIVPDFYHDAVRVYSASDGTLISSISDQIFGPYSAVVSEPPPK